LVPSTALAQIEPLDPPEEPLELATDGPVQEVVQQPPQQQHAVPTEPPERDVDLGIRGGGGFAFTRGVDTGYYVRMEMPFYFDHKKGEGGMFLLVGAEGWMAGNESGNIDAAGGGLAYSSNGAFEFGSFFLSLGVGFDIFIVDRVYEETGVGFLVPGAGTSFGLNLDGFKVLAEARGKYRWQFKAEDRSQALVGLSIEMPL
jgi:hypothetical protein